MKMIKIALAGVFILVVSSYSTSQNLYEKIFQEDSLLFDAIFNRHDGEYLKQKLTTDFEFYHDKGGMMASSAESFISDFERIWKNQEEGRKKWMKRKLIKESLEVYPFDNYGALQLANHQFFEIEADGSESHMDNAKIVHLWKLEHGNWKLARIVSYDHQHVLTTED